MAYVSPALEDFLERYPEFTDTSMDEARFEGLLMQAEVEVNDSWIEGDRLPAVLALIAHLATSESFSGISGGRVSGPIVSETVGPLSIDYKSTTTTQGKLGDFTQTAYGVLYDQLRRRSFPPILVV